MCEAAEQRFLQVFERAPAGLAVVGPDGRIERVNEAVVHVTGFARAELQGRPALELLHPDERDRPLHGERRCLHALGDVVWVALQAEPLAGRDATLLQLRDVTDRRRYEAQLQYLTDHDPLTGLLNRGAFEREVHRHLARGLRYGPEGAVVVLDLDGFRAVNDLLGHAVGDDLIIDAAQALRDRLRDSDVVARLAADEFAVLLPKVGRDDARRVASDLVASLRGVRVRRPDGRARCATASAGVAVFADLPEECGVDDVLVRADLALSDAKDAGGDGLALHGDDQPGALRALARHTWAERIRTALEEDRFVLHAQPIADLATGVVRQHELLLRMLDDDGGPVLPATFLHVAERSGLMPEVDRWVVRQALRHLAADPSLILEVNLSGGSTGDPELLRLIEEGVRDGGVAPGRLVLEITETVAIANIGRAQRFAARLAELGCRFALDDFGAGFGSFYYLKHLPFDVLKIDGEFVRSCASSSTDQVLIRAVVDIARGLGKTTVAEHVGDDDTVALLRDLGVDLGQGFHLGRPAPLRDLAPSAAA